MGYLKHHARLAKEKHDGAIREFEEKRFTNVADLSLKCIEQLVEAAASADGLHFHLKPRTAHAERNRWAKERFPEISQELDILWSVYGDLGCDGLNGKRAAEAIHSMEEIIRAVQDRTGIKLEEAD